MRKKILSIQKWIEDSEAWQWSLDEYLLDYTMRELECSEDDVLVKMRGILQIMEKSIAYGLTGVKSHSGLTGGSAKRYIQDHDNCLLGELGHKAVAYALAVAECNAAMGCIAAAPTAGASGVLPGVLFALKEEKNLSYEQLERGLVVAGSIGMVIAERASLSGAMGGCQAECGSAAAMAAGAAVSLLGGSAKQVGDAVAIVFKNVLGLVCDPVAGLVEVPCIKRNGACALQAILAAEMALTGIGSFIPPDEAIDAMKSVGDSLPCSLRETAGGGLATTPAALAWAKEYFERKE